jgi:hypothetical protein
MGAVLVSFVEFEKEQAHHFQQYFNYIMATSFSGGRSRVPGKKPRSWASNWQILSLAAAS